MEILDKEGNPTKELFVFLKYNQTVENVVSLPQSEDEMFNEFCNKWKDLMRNLENGLSASSALGSLLSMFGFKRHYCSTCGLPIIGKFSKIGNRVTCDPCFQSFKIIQEMEKRMDSKNPQETIQDIKLGMRAKPAIIKGSETKMKPAIITKKTNEQASSSDINKEEK